MYNKLIRLLNDMGKYLANKDIITPKNLNVLECQLADESFNCFLDYNGKYDISRIDKFNKLNDKGFEIIPMKTKLFEYAIKKQNVVYTTF